jgi:hypothetical protein
VDDYLVVDAWDAGSQVFVWRSEGVATAMQKVTGRISIRCSS